MPKNKLTWGIIDIRNGRWSTNSSVSERLWDRWRDCWVENTNVLKSPIKNMAGGMKLQINNWQWVLSWTLLEDIYPSNRAAIEPGITGWSCSAHIHNIFGGTFISTVFFSGKGPSVTWDSPTHVESFFLMLWSSLTWNWYFMMRTWV